MPLPSLEVTASSSLLSVTAAPPSFWGFHINFLETRHCQCLCPRFFPRAQVILLVACLSSAHFGFWSSAPVCTYTAVWSSSSSSGKSWGFVITSVDEHREKNKLRSGKAKLELIYAIFFLQMQVSFCCVWTLWIPLTRACCHLPMAHHILHLQTPHCSKSNNNSNQNQSSFKQEG